MGGGSIRDPEQNFEKNACRCYIHKYLMFLPIVNVRQAFAYEKRPGIIDIHKAFGLYRFF